MQLNFTQKTGNEDHSQGRKKQVARFLPTRKGGELKLRGGLNTGSRTGHVENRDL